MVQESIQKARELAFRKRDPSINKPYISEVTMNLRRERQEARNANDGEKERQMHRKVRNSVKKRQEKVLGRKARERRLERSQTNQKGFRSQVHKAKTHKWCDSYIGGKTRHSG